MCFQPDFQNAEHAINKCFEHDPKQWEGPAVRRKTVLFRADPLGFAMWTAEKQATTRPSSSYTHAVLRHKKVAARPPQKAKKYRTMC